MARRRDGRELFEIFRETKAAQGAGVQQENAYVGREPGGQARTPSLHTLRLGDRRQVEVFLSLGWVYGIAFFVFLALVGAFILGRRTAPEPGPVAKVEAPEGFADETATVTYGQRQPAAAPADETPEAASQPEAPAPVTSQGLWTLCVVTYRNASAQRQMAEEFVDWLTEQGYDARIVTSSSGKNLYATIGSFETTTSEEARNLLAEVTSLKFKKASLGDAYYENVNKL